MSLNRLFSSISCFTVINTGSGLFVLQESRDKQFLVKQIGELSQ